MNNAEIGVTAEDWEWALRAKLGVRNFQEVQCTARHRARDRAEREVIAEESAMNVYDWTMERCGDDGTEFKIHIRMSYTMDAVRVAASMEKQLKEKGCTMLMLRTGEPPPKELQIWPQHRNAEFKP